MSKEKIENKTSIKPSADTRITDRGATLTRGFDTIFDDFRRSFDNLMAPFLPMRSLSTYDRGFPVRYPLCDLVDHGDDYTVRAELPGFSKDMIDVEVNKNTLLISAELKQEEEEESEGNFLHRERTYSKVQRSITFPEEVNPDRVEGTMKDGILKLKIGKKEPKPEEKLRKVELK